ncbi:TlpA family protein disulfide reductase, partial [Fulvivirga sp. RKSG066]|uniref:TlpA disulfide reductase family protein n=1 Tax=Fulvivirga aurantia TaxID=2529383 RepID=UPI0012BB725E
MKQFCLISLFIFSASSISFGQNKAEVIKFDKLAQLMSDEGDNIQVINFWATWCAPCIKEIPYFEALPAQVEGRDITVTLISMDFVEKLDRVNSFIERKEIASGVLLLDNIDYNSWIDRVDESWSGAIPATMFIDSKTGKKKFIEGELEKEELNQ